MKNIHKIQVGMEFKNYKVLCECLEVPVYNGTQKKVQIKEMSRFFDWDKTGNKFLVTKVYDKPKVKKVTPKRKPNENIVLESLLLNLLSTFNGKMVVSKSYLYLMLQMINYNYMYAKRAPHLLANYIDVDIENVNEFYERTKDVLERNINNTLKSLYSRSLIDYATTRMVCVVDVNAEYNTNGELSANIYDSIDIYGVISLDTSAKTSQTVRRFRQATDKENDYIRGVEHEELNNIGAINKQELIRSKKWNDWNKKVNERIRKEKNIAYYYQGYEIRANPEHVDIELEKLEKEQIALLGVVLNFQIKSQIMNNTYKRQERANKSLMLDNNINRRQQPNYFNEQLKIANTVIDITMPDKVPEIKENYIHKIKTMSS